MGLLDPPAYSRSAADTRFAPVAVADTVDYLTDANVKKKAKRAPDNITWVTKFASGHGWTTSASEINLNATDVLFAAAQGVKYGPADPNATKTLNSPTLSPTLDMTGKVLVLALRSLDANGAGLSVFLGNSTLTSYRLYSNPKPENYSVENGWTLVTIHPDGHSTTVGTPDMAAIQKISIRFEDPTGTHTEMLGAVGTAPIPSKYPNGVVTIDFDDNSPGQFDLARPLMVARGFPGTICAIGEAADAAANGAMSVSDMHMLEDMFGWEIGGHSALYTDHVDMRTLTDAQLDNSVLRMRQWLRKNRFRSNWFAYPNGNMDNRVRAVVRKNFPLGRSTGPNGVITTYPVTANLHALPCHFPTTSADVSTRITTAVARKQWLALGFHGITSGTPTGSQISLTEFTAILDAIVAAGMPVVTPSTLFDLDR